MAGFIARGVLLALALCAGGSASAKGSLDGLALARSNVCLSCHQVDARRVGPPFQSIAQRYAKAADHDATVEYLIGPIRQGGRGRWGAIPMPAQPQVSERDARLLAEWILSLAE